MAANAETEVPPTFEEESTIIAAEPETGTTPDVIAATKAAEEPTEAEEFTYQPVDVQQQDDAAQEGLRRRDIPNDANNLE